MHGIINEMNVPYIALKLPRSIFILYSEIAEVCQEGVSILKSKHIDDMLKTLDIATAFFRGEGIRWCPKCGTELELSQTDPWSNGVFCPCCKSSFPWQHWSHFGEKWIWDASSSGLVSFHGDEEEADIPNCCTKICSYAFSDSSVTVVRVPNSVTVIEPYAFSNTNRLERVTLPYGLQRIEEGTFMGCDKLKYITIPKTVKYIGRNAFSGCTSLRTVLFPDGLAMIDAGAFSGSGLVDLKLSGVTLVGERAFAECPLLHSVALMVKHIGKACFAGCKSLRDAKLSETVMTIGEEAFRDCRSLAYFHIPASVYEFGNHAFAGIPKLVVHIPKSLEEHVQNYRFYQVPFDDEKNYIFDHTATLHYYEGGA